MKQQNNRTSDISSGSTIIHPAQPIHLVNARELQSLLTIQLAMCLSASIIDALAVHPVSSSSVVASAVAMAAAVARITHQKPRSLAAQTTAAMAATATATAAAAASATQAGAGAPAAAASTSTADKQMFNDIQVADMLEIVDCNLLHEFQKVMFAEGQLQNLDWRDESAVVRL